MDEITFKKSINSVRHLAEYQYAENFLDYPDAEDFDEYQYAKNFLDHPQHSEGMESSLAEMIVSLCKTSRPQESFPSYLIDDSRETKWAWDALNLVTQDWLRKGKPLPPELAGWIADVLADQFVKKGPKRRPRPGKGSSSFFSRDLLLCQLVDQLAYLFGLNATRNDGDPPVSACDVVAAAMGKSYKTVERIWGKRDPVLEDLFSSWNKQALIEKFLYPR